MNSNYIIALDQGTTSSRAIVFDHGGNIVDTAQQEFAQHYPQSGWVEHDPQDIWKSQLDVLQTCLSKYKPEHIAAIGITNQRETTLVWERATGEAVHRAIVWQDRRTAAYCDQLKQEGWTEKIQAKTGLILDAYFSATKCKYILDQIENGYERAQNGELCFGTVDSWIIFNLTEGKVHTTDCSNASRTMLFNIHDLTWDNELLELFGIPHQMLPSISESSEIVGYTSVKLSQKEIPIAGIAGDQQAALFGQMCTEPGMMKNTYGTGCFMIANTGSEVISSKNQLLSTVAWKIGGQVSYGLEGSIFVAGAAIQWLRDGLAFFDDAKESEALASSVEDTDGVYFVPALTGLAAPHWNQYARGAILGISRGTTKAHITRAALEGIAFQVNDVIESIAEDLGDRPTELRVDGGATHNNLLMQIQSDLASIKVVRPKVLETTALGAAYLAGLAVGYWSDIESLKKQWQLDQTFTINKDHEAITKRKEYWNEAVKRSMNWSNTGD